MGYASESNKVTVWSIVILLIVFFTIWLVGYESWWPIVSDDSDTNDDEMLFFLQGCVFLILAMLAFSRANSKRRIQKAVAEVAFKEELAGMGISQSPIVVQVQQSSKKDVSGGASSKDFDSLKERVEELEDKQGGG